MKSSYKIIPNSNLLIETLKKTISTNEYTKLKFTEFQDKKFSRTYNLITDLSDFDKKEDIKIIEELYIIFKENKGKFIRNKSALIVSNPELLKEVISMVKKDQKIYKEIKIFSDIDKAKKWMQ